MIINLTYGRTCNNITMTDTKEYFYQGVYKATYGPTDSTQYGLKIIYRDTEPDEDIIVRLKSEYDPDYPIHKDDNKEILVKEIIRAIESRDQSKELPCIILVRFNERKDDDWDITGDMRGVSDNLIFTEPLTLENLSEHFLMIDEVSPLNQIDRIRHNEQTPKATPEEQWNIMNTEAKSNS